MKSYKILAINPGSTSTKIALYEGEKEVMELTLRHTSEQLQQFGSVIEQFEFRREIILSAVAEAGVDVNDIDAVIGRGGLIKPIESGVYEVNDALKNDLLNSPFGQHASNLGGLIAADIAKMIGVRAFIADPVVVDELQDVARISGHPLLGRVSIFHALNQKAIARAYAAQCGKRYEDMSLVVAHLGGGISVGAHKNGRVIDVNNALDGEGPFSPERSGTLPAGSLASLCFSGKYTYADIKKMLCGAGGLVAHLGTNEAREAVRMAQEEGDKKAQLVVDAMVYNICKYIGAMATVLHGKLDAIIITGGIANNVYVCGCIKEMVDFLGKIVIMPGENELEALSINALRVLRNETEPKIYR